LKGGTPLKGKALKTEPRALNTESVVVNVAVCEFCKREIEPGTGKKFVYKDGKVISLCSSKCEKNIFVLKHKSRTTGWTNEFHKLKRAPEKGAKSDLKKPVKKKADAKEGAQA
jgi:large subunit ribosomal protein L24e